MLTFQQFTVVIAQDADSKVQEIAHDGGRIVFLEFQTPATLTGTNMTLSVVSPNDNSRVYVPTTAIGNVTANSRGFYRATDRGYPVPCEKGSADTANLSWSGPLVTALKVDSDGTEGAARTFTVTVGVER